MSKEDIAAPIMGVLENAAEAIGQMLGKKTALSEAFSLLASRKDLNTVDEVIKGIDKRLMKHIEEGLE